MKKTIGLFVIFLFLISFAQAQVCNKDNTPRVNIPASFELNQGEQFLLEINVSKNVGANITLIPINSELEIVLNKGILSTTPQVPGMHTFFLMANTVDGCYDLKKIAFKVFQRPNITYYSPDYLKLQMYENTVQKFMVEAKNVKYYWFLDGHQIKNGSNAYIFRTNYSSAGKMTLSAVVIDNRNLNTTLTWNIDISNINRRPVVNNQIPDITITKDSSPELLDFNDYISDPDGDDLIFNYTFVDEKNNPLNGSKVFEVTITKKGLLKIVPKSDILRKEYLRFGASDGYQSILLDKISVELAVGQNRSILLRNIKLDDCEPEITCTEWGECLPQNIRVRICKDINNCNQEGSNVTEVEGCEYGATCEDKIKNQGEEGVDCGGPCPDCPTCTDKIQNQGEEGIDCGGPCDSCPNCNDYLLNQDESDVDCGGVCISCDFGKICNTHKDCQSFVCEDNICLEATCYDTRKNQGEDKIDCGGPCEPCPSCNDGLLNQGEEGIDCGGPCKSCESCDDGIKNQDETFTDCGGKCECAILTFYEQYNLIIYLSFFIFLLFIGIRIFIFKNYTSYLLFGTKIFGFMPDKMEDYSKNSSQAIKELKTLQLQIPSLEYYKVNESYKQLMDQFFRQILLVDDTDEYSFKRELKSKVKNPYKRKMILMFFQFVKKSTGSSTLYKLEMNEKINETIRLIEMLR